MIALSATQAVLLGRMLHSPLQICFVGAGKIDAFQVALAFRGQRVHRPVRIPEAF